MLSLWYICCVYWHLRNAMQQRVYYECSSYYNCVCTNLKTSLFTVTFSWKTFSLGQRLKQSITFFRYHSVLCMLAVMWDFLWLRVFSVSTVSVLTKVNQVFLCLQNYFPLEGMKEMDSKKLRELLFHTGTKANKNEVKFLSLLFFPVSTQFTWFWMPCIFTAVDKEIYGCVFLWVT